MTTAEKQVFLYLMATMGQQVKPKKIAKDLKLPIDEVTGIMTELMNDDQEA